jgi:hypothetical protein
MKKKIKILSFGIALLTLAIFWTEETELGVEAEYQCYGDDPREADTKCDPVFRYESLRVQTERYEMPECRGNPYDELAKIDEDAGTKAEAIQACFSK